MRILVGVPKMARKMFKIPNPLYIWMLVASDQHSGSKNPVKFDDLFIPFSVHVIQNLTCVFFLSVLNSSFSFEYSYSLDPFPYFFKVYCNFYHKL